MKASKKTAPSTESPFSFQIQKSWPRQQYGELRGWISFLTGSTNRKHVSDMKDYVKPTKILCLYILHIGANDLSLKNSPETIVE